uniref:Malate dehydrogenase n=1 Tax=Rhizophora mucronata TaxID=61149 RepID=A0A2P2LTY8_RHIMU
MLTRAFGQNFAIASQRPLTIPALMLKRSSRVIPGFLGTPAGMITTSDPSKALPSCSSPMYPTTSDLVLIWLTSAATPGVLAIS